MDRQLDPAMAHDALAWQLAPRLFGLPLIFNLPAFGIVVVITWVVLIGIRETARFNTVLVVVKLAIVVFFLALGGMDIRPANWAPVCPERFPRCPQRCRHYLLRLYRIRRRFDRRRGNA